MGVQPETYLQRSIRTLIQKRGGYAIKQHGSMISEPGIPDILACYKGFFLAIEAKEVGNTPSKQQGIHIRNIQKSCGITCVIWDIDKLKIVLDIIDNYETYNEPYTTTRMKILKEENIDTGEKW